MVKVTFTDNLQRHVQVSELSVSDGSVLEVFEQVFTTYPELKPYILDEQQRLRKHIMLAVDSQLIQGSLTPYLEQTGFQRLHIMQALSGG